MDDCGVITTDRHTLSNQSDARTQHSPPIQLCLVRSSENTGHIRFPRRLLPDGHAEVFERQRACSFHGHRRLLWGNDNIHSHHRHS